MEITRDYVMNMQDGSGAALDVTPHVRIAIRRNFKRYECRAYYETTELKVLTAFSARQAWRIWQQMMALYGGTGTR